MDQFSDNRPKRSLLADLSIIDGERARIDSQIQKLEGDRDRRRHGIDVLDSDVRGREARLKIAARDTRRAIIRFNAERLAAILLKTADGIVGRRLATPVIGAVVAAAFFISLNLLDPPTRFQVIGLFIGAIIGVAGWLWIARIPASDRLPGWVLERRSVATNLVSRRDILADQVAAARKRAASARREFDEFLRQPRRDEPECAGYATSS